MSTQSNDQAPRNEEEERKKAHRAFQQADHKFEKELGKVLNEIQGLAGGKEPEVTDEAQTA